MKTKMSSPKQRTSTVQPLPHSTRTELGKILRGLRSAIVVSGAELLDWDQLDRERAERRGENNGEAGA